jgi:hypothetical protein
MKTNNKINNKQIFIALNDYYFHIGKRINAYELFEQITTNPNEKYDCNNPKPKKIFMSGAKKSLVEEIKDTKEEYVRDMLRKNDIPEEIGYFVIEKNPEYEPSKERFEKEYGNIKIYKINIENIRL